MNEHSFKEDILNILRVISSDDDVTQRDLSSHLGMSLGKTNYLLKSLAQKGLVKIHNFAARKGKLQKVKYILTKEGLEEKIHLTYYFLKRKEEEYLQLRKELEKSTNEATPDFQEINS